MFDVLVAAFVTSVIGVVCVGILAVVAAYSGPGPRRRRTEGEEEAEP